MLMLQLAEKNQKAKRRALLMGGGMPPPPADPPLSIPSRGVTATAPEPGDETRPPASSPLPVEKTGAARQGGTDAVPETAAHPGESPQPAGSLARTLNFVPSHEPQLLPGDAFERMRMDPEIKEFRKRLIVGASLVVGCVVLALLIRALTAGQGGHSVGMALSEPEAGQPAIIEEDPELSPVPDGGLVFKAIGKQDFTNVTATAAAPTGAASSQLTMDMALSAEALRKFLAAPDWKQRLSWSRPVNGLKERMAAFYAKNADGPVLHENIIDSKEAPAGFFEHTVVMEGGGRRTALVEKTPKGPRVDWAAFVGAGDLGWSQLMEEKPVLPVTMRVMVSDGFFYEHQFGNPRLVKCLELRCVSEAGAPVIMGYIEREHAIAHQIEFWLKQSNGAALPLILKLKYPFNSASPKQVWISEIVRQGWQDS
jgi:hypothetical protein